MKVVFCFTFGTVGSTVALEEKDYRFESRPGLFLNICVYSLQVNFLLPEYKKILLVSLVSLIAHSYESIHGFLSLVSVMDGQSVQGVAHLHLVSWNYNNPQMFLQI